MIRLKVDIDVKNHEEIINNNKGLLVGYLSRFFKDSEQKVEEEIYKEVRKALENSLKAELAKKGVRADVSVY